jgi:lipooligosaccharide transport system ATP-binding protein
VELRFASQRPPDDLAPRLDGLVHRTEVLSGRLLLYTDDGDRTAEKVHELGVEAQSTLVRRSTLEDVFLHLTGRTLVDE